MTYLDINNRIHDKHTFGSGEWMHEPDVRLWVYKGYICAVVRSYNLGHLCGYVAVPKGHAAFGLTDMDHPNNIYVHGGITYGKSGCYFLKYDYEINDDVDTEIKTELTKSRLGVDDLWTVGFDCGHSSDLSPFLSFNYQDGEYRNIKYVMEQVESLADQLDKLNENK